MLTRDSNGYGHHGREGEDLSGRAPLAQSVRHRQRLTASLEGENANRQRALVRTLAEVRALSWLVDPGIRWCGRIKSMASISAKMSINHVGVDQVLDVIGIRAITRHARDCYQLVNRIHREFEALDYEYNDYIAVPKRSGYRSLHTTVISPSGYPVEIQTRTRWMHALCERGPAAHSRYKKNRVAWMPLPRAAFCPGGV